MISEIDGIIRRGIICQLVDNYCDKELINGGKISLTKSCECNNFVLLLY